MKLIALISLFLSCSCIMAQTTTGEIIFIDDFSANITVDDTNVTLTLIGDETRYVSVGFGVTSMTAGGDIVSYDATGFNDRQFSGIGITPSTDTQDWTVVSNEVTAGLRTLVVTRPLAGSDASDYTFDPGATSLDLVWAYGSTLNFANHGNNRGTTNVSLTLGDQGEIVTRAITLYPIPAENTLTLVLQNVALKNQTSVSIISSAGILVKKQPLTQELTHLDVSKLPQGMYFVKVESATGNLNSVFIKRFPLLREILCIERIPMANYVPPTSIKK
mgnify:CR=1 FL=1